MTSVLAPHATTSLGRGARVRGPLLLGGGTVVATLALHLRDPHQFGSWGVCPFAILTGGLDCPGCGGLRAVNDLTHGDLLSAASSNLLFVALVPFLVTAWVVWVWSRWTGRPSPVRLGGRAGTALGVGLLVLTLVFAVVRNTPWGGWLHS